MSLEFSSSTKKNIGRSKLDKLPGLIKYLIIVPNDFELADADIASADALITALNAAFKAAYADRAFLYPPFVKSEDVSEEAIREDSPLSLIDVRPGQYRFKLHVSKNMFIHKAIATHKYINEGRAILIDLENKICLTTKANGKHTGQRIALVSPEKMDMSDGSNSTTSPIYVCLADNKEWDENGKLLDGSLVVGDLEPLTDVKIEVAGAFAAATFKVDVKVESDNTPVSGLLLADFKMYAADGVTEQVINAVAEDANVPGRYTITAPGGNDFEDGTLTLRAASALTISGFENPERLRLTVNIP